MQNYFRQINLGQLALLFLVNRNEMSDILIHMMACLIKPDPQAIELMTIDKLRVMQALDYLQTFEYIYIHIYIYICISRFRLRYEIYCQFESLPLISKQNIIKLKDHFFPLINEEQIESSFGSLGKLIYSWVEGAIEFGLTKHEILGLKQKFQRADELLKMQSKEWPKVKQFIEGGYKILIFSSHIDRKTYMLRDFLFSEGYNLDKFMDFEHQLRIGMKKHKPKCDVCCDTRTFNLPMVYNPFSILEGDTQKTNFNILFMKRIFVSSRAEQMAKIIRKYELACEYDLPEKCLNIPRGKEESRELGRKIIDELMGDDIEESIWLPIYYSIEQELHKIEDLRERHSKIHDTGTEDSYSRQNDMAYDQISDYFCSLTAVRYILDCGGLKDDIETEVRRTLKSKGEREWEDSGTQVEKGDIYVEMEGKGAMVENETQTETDWYAGLLHGLPMNSILQAEGPSRVHLGVGTHEAELLDEEEKEEVLSPEPIIHIREELNASSQGNHLNHINLENIPQNVSTTETNNGEVVESEESGEEEGGDRGNEGVDLNTDFENFLLQNLAILLENQRELNAQAEAVAVNTQDTPNDPTDPNTSDGDSST